ncbi:EVE domain-containing protein [Kribbella sp. NPDC004875]|uniref:EVE domain-containing protein n=1 Tax=Kribbella sp. NPDC004875 TaxID=3364107 RepID=UPI003691782A
MNDQHRAWLGVISADHTRRAVDGGFIQLNHGKRYGVARLRKGDGFAIYSPTERYGEKRPLRAFTALGIVADETPYRAEPMDMGSHGVVQPWRRRIEFFPVRRMPVGDLDLELTRGSKWGYQLRRGLVQLTPGDFDALREQMVAKAV